MSFFSRLFGSEQRSGPLENPKLSMGAAFNWLFGGNQTAAGEVVNEFSAMQQATVYACVRTIAEAIGSLTLRTYTRLPKGRSEAIDDPLYKVLSLVPNDEMPSVVLWENVVGSLALSGNSYVEIIRDKSKQPLQLYPLPTMKTEPVRLPDGKLAYRTHDYSSGGTRILQAADTLHFRLFSYDGLKGLSPIEQCKQTIGWSVAALKASARFHGNGSKPPAILTPVGDIDEQDLINMRTAWEAANGGENQGRTAVLPSDWKYTALGINAKDAQFLESMQFVRSDIAAIFRVPAHMVGDTSKVSNNNVTEMNRGFVLDCLNPYLVKIEQEICIKLFNGDAKRFVQFDTSERLRGDYKTQMDGIAVGRQWGILTKNEAREQLSMNPSTDDDADITIIPANMQNSARLTDTESLQDQPIGTDPNAPAVGDTKGMRSYFAHYAKSFTPLFGDAVGRYSCRSKRDIDSLTPIFSPVLESITDLIEGEARSEFALDAEWHNSGKVARDYLKGLSTRAADWTAENKLEATRHEVCKAVRALRIGIYREAGATVAEKGLQDE